MSTTMFEDVKGSPDVSTTAAESPKLTQERHGQTIVLIPQPSDDPEDPLV